ncbi:MAG TPA: hypothetical protein VJP40_01330 [bacterium]|nr:hypothetical protein [bacterium]
MGTHWTVTKDGIRLEVEAPQPGERFLRGRLSFSEWGPDSEATVALGLLSRKHRAFPLSEPWRGELEAPSTRKKLRPGDDGRVDFELPYPAWMQPFRGSALEIVLVALVRSSEGTTMRMPLQGMPAPSGTRHHLLKPVEKVMGPPRLPWLSALLAKLGFRRARRWHHLGELRFRCEAIEEDPPRIAVSVKGEKVGRRGKVELVVAEFIYSDSSLYKYEPFWSVESPLEFSESGEAKTRLAFPSPDEAPPALLLPGTQIQHGILWELRFHLESRRGTTEQVDLPLSVSSVYPSGSG